MAMMDDFDRDFIERTIEILDNCSKYTKYDVTLLLNCLLALVTLPIERKKYHKNILLDSETVNFQKDCVEKIKQLKNEDNYYNDNDEYFFNNIRNAIAHLHILVDKGKSDNMIENVTLINAENEHKFKDGIINLSINISVENLRIFAKYVAEEYLKRFFKKC